VEEFKNTLIIEFEHQLPVLVLGWVTVSPWKTLDFCDNSIPPSCKICDFNFILCDGKLVELKDH